MENFKGTSITSLINLADLPKELQFEIMLYLDDPAIISNLTLINKNFYNLLQNQVLWQLLLKDFFFKLSNRFGIYSVQTDWKLFNNYILNSKQQIGIFAIGLLYYIICILLIFCKNTQSNLQNGKIFL